MIPDRLLASREVAVISVRPKVAELVFQVYGRPMHPEFFDVFQSRLIQRGKYEARIYVTSTGHLISWKFDNLILSEVATSATHALPDLRRLMSYRIKGNRADRIECVGGIHYEMACSLEPTTPQKLLAYHQQLALPAAPEAVVHRFESSGRFGAGALSYISVDAREKLFRIQAFHTFPDDAAVLRVQSAFRLP